MNNFQAKWLIHFSGDDYWHGNPHSRYHICQAMHNAGYKVLWVNPIGFRMPSITKKGTSGKLWRKIKSVLKFLRKESPNWYVFTPFQLPIFKQSKILVFNRLILNFQLSICKFYLKISHPIALYTTPTFASMVNHDSARRRIYYYSDQYTLYRELSISEKEWMEERDSVLQRAADIVICCSQKIYDNVAQFVSTEKLVYFPHRVDFNKFNNVDKHDLPKELSNIPSPRIGYYGSLSDSNDWEIIKYCAELRPNFQFIFIGKKNIANTETEHLPNVHFLGDKPYALIQNYGAGFDVAVMFWIRRDWIKHSSPLKLKEYLALGIPVVSTLIEEVSTNYSNIVYSAETKEEFLEYLDYSTTNDNSERVKLGINKVKKDTWNDIVKFLEGNAL